MTLAEQSARLLLLAAQAGGRISFAQSGRGLGVRASDLRSIVRSLNGCLVPCDPLSMQPDYELTGAGWQAVETLRRRRPARSLLLQLSSAAHRESEVLQVDVEVGSTSLSSRRFASSYRLAAIRYLLALDPDQITPGTSTRAALEIGDALLPPCASCRGASAEAVRSCGVCIRSVFCSQVADLVEHGGWISVDLDVSPPWTFVPWEMAALTVDDFVALNAGVNLRRTVAAQVEHDGALDGQVTVLLATSAARDDAERQEFEREADAFQRVLEESDSVERQFDVRRLAGWTDVDRLARAVDEVRPRVVHMIGHGSSRGLAGAEGASGKDGVARALSDAGVEVAVFASCFGATESGADAAGASLGRRTAGLGVPRVVAFEGRAEAGHVQHFGEAMYGELSASGSIDQAVHEGRKAMQRGAAYTQWGQVVLFAGVAAEESSAAG